MSTKIRLVLCPNCRNLLPESPDVPVYKCGGCGKVLQAKQRKNVTVDTASQKLEDDSLGKPKMDQVSDDQIRSSNQESLVNSIDEQRGRTHDRNGDQKSENGYEIKEYSSGKQKMEQLADDQEAGSSSNQQLVVNSIDEPDRNGDHNDLHNSTELLGHEDPESLPEATARNRTNQDQSAAKKAENGMVDKESHSNSNRQLLVNLVDEQDRNSDHNDARSSTELSGHEDPESSPEAIARNRMNLDEDHYQEADKKQKSVVVDELSGGLEHSSGKSKRKQLSDDQEAGSRSNHQSMLNSINSNSSELSYHEDLESSPEPTFHNRINQDHHQDQDQDQEHVMLMVNGVLESHKIGAEFERYSFSEIKEIEEPSAVEKATANMKIVRDSDGGSKSSFKSLIAEKLLDTRQRKVVYLDEDETISEDGSADLCHRRRFDRISSVETLENGRFGGTSYEGSISSFDGKDSQVARKNRIGLEEDEFYYAGRHEFRPSKGRRDRSFYGNSAPLNEFHENPRHRSPVIPENPKMERLELLKMVRELQDQLERTNVMNAAQQVLPSHYNHGLNQPGRHAPRMAFSGEATVGNRRRDSGSCYHCYPQDRHFSAQLPRQHVCCNGPHYGPNTCYSSHCSGQSSPQHHLESEFPALVRSKPETDDHWHRNDVPKPYRSSKKRYVRPVAGGSPWVSCYRCSEVVQLPQTFLVYKRRCHSLRCGACMKVLNFTLSDGTHVSRYYPEETIAAPPSSEVEDYAESRVGPGPVSCSDRSFQKSYSTETDRNGWSSRELIEERRKARDHPSSSKISGRRKTTSEIEEIEPPGSPLHWLMGYASPSKVIRGS